MGGADGPGGVRDLIDGILRRHSRLNLVNAGQLLDDLGLRVVLSRIPRDRLARVPSPAVLLQHGLLPLAVVPPSRRAQSPASRGNSCRNQAGSSPARSPSSIFPGGQ